jgi:hypothetical protein
MSRRGWEAQERRLARDVVQVSYATYARAILGEVRTVAFPMSLEKSPPSDGGGGLAECTPDLGALITPHAGHRFANGNSGGAIHNAVFSRGLAERATGLEPATSSLGSWHSTN